MKLRNFKGSNLWILFVTIITIIGVFLLSEYPKISCKIQGGTYEQFHISLTQECSLTGPWGMDCLNHNGEYYCDKKFNHKVDCGYNYTLNQDGDTCVPIK